MVPAKFLGWSKELWIKAYFTENVGVHQCPSVSVNVRQCPSVSVCVRLCPSVSVGVRQCPSVSVGVRQCPSVSVGVRLCPLVSVSVHQCPSMSVGVLRCPSVWSTCLNVLHCVLSSINACILYAILLSAFLCKKNPSTFYHHYRTLN